jgi:hypothetical protein
MADPRYVTVSGRPVFLIYRPLDLPSPQRTIEVWKNEALRLGLKEPYLIASDSHARGRELLPLGYDADVQFLPQLGALDYFAKRRLTRITRRLLTNARLRVLSLSVSAYDYDRALRRMLRPVAPHTHRMIFPAWDNTPRAGTRGIAIVRSSPAKFERALRELSRWTVRHLATDRRILFLNAWNEWAEGNHLEPDARFGTGYLEATRRAKLAASDPSSTALSTQH